MRSQKKIGAEKKDNTQKENNKRRKRKKTQGKCKRQKIERKRLIKLILLGILIGVLMFLFDRVLYIEDSIAQRINIGTNEFKVYLANEVGKMLVVYNGDRDYGMVTIQKDGKYSRNEYIVFKNDGHIISFPYGDGLYIVGFLRHIEDNKFKLLSKKNIEIMLKDEFYPFVGLGYYVDFNKNIADFADKLWVNDINGYIENVFNYALNNVKYDKEFEKAILNGEITAYKPDIEKVISQGKGVCIDKVSLMASLLRIKGIPTKIVTGYVNNNEYHAWLEVYINGEWKLFDPTRNVSYGDTNMQDYTILNYY
jgi:transglutaminase/protease-like cytokinesis protein 3